MALADEFDLKLRLGVSACLIGEAVRFNGGHCANGLLLREAAPFVDLVPVCPEVEIGLGTPRESLRLKRAGDLVLLAAPKSGSDHTAAMRDYAVRKVAELKSAGLDGYVLKKDSPSCGMQRVKVYDENNVPSKTGVGLFAQTLMELWPELPVEEEGRLNDHRLRENFFERVFAYRRLQDFFSGEWMTGDLVRFHTAEKLLLLSHDPEKYRRLGRLVAQAAARPREETAREYRALFMQALSKSASVKRQTAVLERILGYFKGRLDAAEKRDLLESMRDFRRGFVPLVAPMTLVQHYVRRFGVDYLAGQTYLRPHPKELMLRAHV